MTKQALSTSKVVVTILLLLSCRNVSAKESSKFTLVENKNLELCQEANKILKEPENKNLFEVHVEFLERTGLDKKKFAGTNKYVFSSAEFAIPKKYKNFRLPTWEVIDVAQASKYVTSSEKLARIRGNKKIEIKKTNADLDHDGSGEVVLQFDTNADSNSKNYKSCYVDESTSSETSQSFNARHSGHDCFLFFYKGQVYKAQHELTSIMIHEPNMVRTQTFAMVPVCIFHTK